MNRKPITRRRFRRHACAIASAAIVTSLLAACGGGGSSGGSFPISTTGSESSAVSESHLGNISSGNETAQLESESPKASSDGVTTNVAPTDVMPSGEFFDKVSTWIAEHLSASPVEPAVEPSAATVQGRSARAAVIPNYGPEAATGGAWSAVQKWPLIAIHAALMPDGRVATYGTNADGQQTGRFIYDLWDSDAASLDTGHMTLPNTTSTDIFCNAQTLLPGIGELFLAGGDNYVNGKTTNTGNNNSVILSSSANSLRQGNNMNRARWYGTVTTMADSRTFVMGGTGGTDRPEIREKNGTFTLLNSADTNQFNYWYPRNFLAPDNRVFGFDVSGRIYAVDPRDGGYVQRMTNFSSDYMGNGSTAVMYAPGQILQVGGNTSRVAKVSINQAVPQFAETTRTSTNRFWGTSTVLPNGRVLMTGGSTQDNQLVGVNNSAEIWNPATGQWTKGASGALARMYHSTALLLPDASVLVAGGGAPGPLVNTNAERYMPPYLFTSSGQPAPRPQITSATETGTPGQMLSIGVSSASAISQVVLIRTGSVTHSFNFDQRRIVLAHQQTGNTLTAQLPANGATVPPGYYMLFVLDGNRVPSVAKIIQVAEGKPQAIGVDWTGSIGGGGGGAFSLECDADEALVGVYGGAAGTLNRIGAQCVRVDAAGRWVGDPSNRDTTGGTAGTAYSRTCPRNSGIVGMSGRSGSLVDNLQLSCGPLASNQRTTGTLTALPAIGGTGGDARALRTCSFNGVARGLYGNSGTLIDAVGLLCRSDDNANAYPFFKTSNTVVQGGSSGTSFNLSCQSDEVLVGISGRSGSWMDRVSALCVKADAEGRWTSDVMARGAAGGTGGGAVTRLCPSGQAVSGFASRTGANVDQLAPLCQPLSSAGRMAGAVTTLAAMGGNGGGANANVVCDSGRPAHGLIGRAGSYVNAIGLSCRGD